MICIISKNQGPRFSYIMSYLSNRTGIKFYSVQNLSDQNNTDQIHISYGAHVRSADEHIPSTGLLFSNEIDAQLEPEYDIINDIPCLFPQSSKGTFQFDIFSAIFYCLSRYEEYQDFEKDTHLRFSGLDSHAVKYKYIHLPLVDHYVALIQNLLAQKLPSIQWPEDHFKIQPTIDIDHAYAFMNKSKSRTILSGAKNVAKAQFSILKSKKKVFSAHEKDPYDTYEFLKEQLIKDDLLQTIFFILMSNESSFDSSNKLTSKEFKDLVQDLRTHFKIGMHPSYHSNQKPEIIALEKQHLESYINQKIELSRQHFLKLFFPFTYQNLIEHGITKDYSMGYHDVIGFRAGTCFSYNWYDLEKEKETDLEIHPFQVMDVTLKQYMNLDPKAAIKAVQKIKQEVRKYNGTFQFIWHNSSFAEHESWTNWEKVFKELLQIT